MTGRESMLGPYRVLDLTEGGCMVGGKILADLGTDVIKTKHRASLWHKKSE